MSSQILKGNLTAGCLLGLQVSKYFLPSAGFAKTSNKFGLLFAKFAMILSILIPILETEALASDAIVADTDNVSNFAEWRLLHEWGGTRTYIELPAKRTEYNHRQLIVRLKEHGSRVFCQGDEHIETKLIDCSIGAFAPLRFCDGSGNSIEQAQRKLERPYETSMYGQMVRLACDTANLESPRGKTLNDVIAERLNKVLDSGYGSLWQLLALGCILVCLTFASRISPVPNYQKWIWRLFSVTSTLIGVQLTVNLQFYTIIVNNNLRAQLNTELPENFSWLILFSVIGAIALCFYISSKALMHSKKMFASIVSSNIVIEKIAPVLYLRSFLDDSKSSRFSYTRFHIETEEEQISRLMSKVGPLVTIGMPTELLPWPGAARVYVKADEDNNWHEQVMRLMRSARMVVIRTNVTAGLLWEVGEVLKNVDRNRILFLVSSGRRGYENFRGTMRSSFKLNLPIYAGKKNTDASITGVIFFDQHGNVQAHWFPGSKIAFFVRKVILPLLLFATIYLFAWSLVSFIGAISAADATKWGYVLLISICAFVALPVLVLIRLVGFFVRKSRFERVLQKSLLPIFNQIQDHAKVSLDST